VGEGGKLKGEKERRLKVSSKRTSTAWEKAGREGEHRIESLTLAATRVTEGGDFENTPALEYLRGTGEVCLRARVEGTRSRA